MCYVASLLAWDIHVEMSRGEETWWNLKERACRQRRASCDTIVVPAREETFQEVFLGKHEWHGIKISPAMKERVKYIAAYRVAPIRAVTHLAAVKEIRPYNGTRKYQLIFDGPAQEITHVPLQSEMFRPQAPFYVQKDKLLAAKTLDEARQIPGRDFFEQGVLNHLRDGLKDDRDAGLTVDGAAR